MAERIEIWKPIEPLKNPADLAIPELRTLFKIWREQRDSLKDNDAYRQFIEKWIRRWSIETGILERIYDISRGVTEILIEQGFNASLISHGEADKDPHQIVSILEDHREAYNFLMDFIGSKRKLSISWIKELHQLLMRHQDTTIAVNPEGTRIEIPLIKGDWKKRPNNPIRPDGKEAVYCPPEQVASEMENLIKYYHLIPNEYSEVRAAWLHHRFSQIHPFQDGNGRVARCLANLDFIKAGGFPIIIQRDDRWEYINALESADQGDLKPLIGLFAKLLKKAFLQAISISQETLTKDSALEQILDAAKARIEKRRRTKREKADELAYQLQSDTVLYLNKQKEKIERQLTGILPGFKIYVSRSSHGDSHYYSKQAVDIAKEFNYWVDFHASRYWVKMIIRNTNNSNFVVLIHQVGRPSQGTGVVVGFIEFLESERSETINDFVLCCAEPFIFTHEDQFDEIKNPYLEWLNQSFLAGMAEWQKRL